MTTTAPEALHGVEMEGYHTRFPIASIIESPKNPRRHYDEAALRELADNLVAVGQITPVLVRPVLTRDDASFELAAGHRRVRAARLAGLTHLAVIVREMDDAQFAEILNVENLQRDDLNPLEEADGFRTLMTDAGYDVARIAARVGRSVHYVYDRLKLLQLIPAVQQLLRDGTLTAAHGALLARLRPEDQERAMDGPHKGGVFAVEHAGETHLDLDDRVKPRSVRELKHWIDEHVRFVPDQVEQADLAFDLPETAALLEQAAEEQVKVVAITRHYRVPDAARDGAQRTYGSAHWKRADGKAEPYDEWGAPSDTAQPSEPCGFAIPGVVVAGPGRGEAFGVCVAKDKCTTHWAQEMREKAKAAKERVRQQQVEAKAAPDPKADARIRRRRLEDEAAELTPDRIRTAVLAQVKAPLPPEVLVELVMEMARGEADEHDCRVLQDVLGSEQSLTPWGDGPPRLRKALLTASPDQLAQAVVLMILTGWNWETRPSAMGVAEHYGVSPAAVGREVLAELTARDKAERASAKQAEAAAKPAKRRAGDVARAKQAKRAKRATPAADS